MKDLSADVSPAMELKIKKSILGLGEQEIVEYCERLGFRPFHGRQILKWVYWKFPEGFGEMSDIPKNLRERLKQDFDLNYLSPSKKQVSKKEDAVKYCFFLEDGAAIEAVVLYDSNRRTSFCVSSQVGCPVGCAYCATGTMGLMRNLTEKEIISEVVSLVKLHERPDSLLFMGMGEPLLNFEALTGALYFFSAIDISARKVTVSTCGVVNAIERLADTGLKPRLAVSIGSAIEHNRQKLIPLSRSNPLSRLKPALISYARKTGRRISLEYTMLGGVNDTAEEAAALARFAKETRSHVNVIRYNPSSLLPFRTPSTEKVNLFKEILTEHGVEVSERYRKGADIQAACGQLAPRAQTS